MSAPRARSVFGDGAVDSLITQLLHAVGEDNNDDMIRRLIVTALEMDAEDVDRLELKIASQTLVEMLNAYKVFSADPGRAKVTVFGSARTDPADPDYALARDFSAAIAERDWMIISGAGPGIMTAAIEGAGVENSYGVSIVLPFESRAADIIDGDPKLAVFRYFFTRKLFFMKESDAYALFPGGFGTLDEAFEMLTLMQTGKTYPAPIVLLDAEGSNYWNGWERFVEESLAGNGMVSPADTSLYLHTHDPAEAVDYVCHFYSCFHSMRYVGKRLILRTHHPVSDDTVAALNAEFADIVAAGSIEVVPTTEAEVNDDDHVHLPRLGLQFDNRSFARLHEMIQRLNDLHGADDAAPLAHDLVHDLQPMPEEPDSGGSTSTHQTN